MLLLSVSFKLDELRRYLGVCLLLLFLFASCRHFSYSICELSGEFRTERCERNKAIVLLSVVSLRISSHLHTFKLNDVRWQAGFRFLCYWNRHYLMGHRHSLFIRVSLWILCEYKVPYYILCLYVRYWAEHSIQSESQELK